MNPTEAHAAIRLIDLTNLNDDCTALDVAALCERAIEHQTAAVCVWPDFVRQAAASVSASGVQVATVLNFPTGDERPFSVATQAERAVADGATELDVVLPYRAYLAGDTRRCGEVLFAVRSAASRDVHVKVILETGELLDDDTVARAAEFAIAHGADFIKTSTGKSPVSATPEAVTAMLQEIARADRPVGLKPSGGISTPEAAATYLDLAAAVMGEAWVTPDAFRFGASGLLDALVEVSRRA